MANQNLVDRLNEISDLFSLEAPSKGEACSTFGIGSDHELYLVGENAQKFKLAVDALIYSITNLKGTISRDFVIHALIPLIRGQRINGSHFGPSEADKFKDELCSLPLRRFKDIRRIFGVDLSRDAGPLRFGDFQIDFGRRMLTPTLISSQLQTFKPEYNDQLFIQTMVEARDAAMAVALADTRFYRFELVFRFLIGRRTDRVEVGIDNHTGPQMRDRFLLSENGDLVNQGYSWKGSIQLFILNDPRFPQSTPSFDKLFGLISRNHNELQERVLRCAEWTGQAIAEPNAASALVKAAIALEVLFSASEKGVITPSIQAQISEACAFLLGDNKDVSIGIERQVKHLYGIRSAVVHSGKDSVDEEDLDSIINICRSLVILLLSKEEFAKITTMDQLAEYLKGRKYSQPNP